MRKLVLASVLALAVSAPAHAHDMQFGLKSLTAPTPTQQQSGTAAEPPADFAVANEEADHLTEALLSLIAGVLALL